MTFNSLILIFAIIIPLMVVGSIVISGLFKNRKRSAESIYKLIDDLEKKYIY